MLPLSHFKRFDVRPLLSRGELPLPEIRQRLAGLAHNEGLLVQAPFLPSPLIEILRSEGYETRFERGSGADWLVYFWRAV
jgi:hypothetical protein